MPRYVILEHDFPVLHWDLMLESGSVLRTWRLAEVPEAAKIVPAEPSFDHRLVYLDYEGPISGARGSVRRWDQGTFTLVRETSDRLICRLSGLRLAGLLQFTKLTDEHWQVQLG